MASKCRQNYHEESEASINKQINIELNAHYQYLALSSYYDRDDVALKGFSKFFKHSAEEEHEHAEKLMKYQNLRGGRVVLTAINRQLIKNGPLHWPQLNLLSIWKNKSISRY